MKTWATIAMAALGVAALVAMGCSSSTGSSTGTGTGTGSDATATGTGTGTGTDASATGTGTGTGSDATATGTGTDAAATGTGTGTGTDASATGTGTGTATGGDDDATGTGTGTATGGDDDATGTGTGATATGTGTGGDGACTNEADMAIQGQVDVQDVITQPCGVGCIGKPENCAGDCVVMETGLSAACAGCYANSINCAIKNCAAKCLPPGTEICIQCRVDNGCIEVFYTCSGLPQD